MSKASLPSWYIDAPPSDGPASLGDVISRLKRVARSAGGFTACCPAHNDSEPSMSVSQGEDGRVLMHCHRGCEFDAIASALGYAPGALMGRAAAEPEATAQKPPSESYVYEDADGRPAFRVERYYVKKRGAWRKQFAQKGADGRGGFAPGMDGVERVVYQLPAVLAAVQAGEPVFVVEGEKDCHTLRDWGLVGTCNPGGAGKWSDALASALTGADVVVLPDNDEPGRAHAATVAASAARVASSVVTVELPGLQTKGDLTDWRRLGNAKSDLLNLVAQVRSLGSVTEAPELGAVRRPLVGLAEVSPSAIAGLPRMLRELCGHYSAGIDRTVALTAAASVLSGMMVNTRVDHYDKPYGLHLMHCLVARSGGGKSILDECGKLASIVDASVREDYKRDLDDWRDAKQDKSLPDPGPMPFVRSYLIAGNASKGALLRGAEAAGEAACIVESEIDTIASAAGQEWGDFTDYVRKAFHHEPYRMLRMGSGGAGESMTIERPSLAIAMSGTWRQFETMFAENVDSGFFNRFSFVVSNAGRAYRSSRPGPQSWNRHAWFSKAAHEANEIFDVLHGRVSPLLISLTDASWDQIDAVYGPAYERAAESPMAERALPFVQRSSLMAVRLAGLLTVLRAWEHNVPLTSPVLTATGYDVSLAVHVASVWYEHGAALLSHLTPLTGPSPLVELTAEAQAVFEILPDSFRRADADAAGEAQGVSARTVKRYLKQYQEGGLILRDGHTYAKVALSSEAVDFDPQP